MTKVTSQDLRREEAFGWYAVTFAAFFGLGILAAQVVFS